MIKQTFRTEKPAKPHPMIRQKAVKKLATLGLAFTFAFSSVISSSAYSGNSGEYTRKVRLEQTSITTSFEKDELGVVNFDTAWGDKDANIKSMDKYIEEADKKGVKILLFPEMCVTGYVSSSDESSKAYQYAVSSAEPIDGPTAKHFAELADKDDMWIIYGATETVEKDGVTDKKHAYNSAFICSPEGEVTTYQKITPVEGSWCTPGETPVIIDTGKYGKLGVSICFDTYSTPELERYYSAMGCNILVNPTASGGGWAAGNLSAWQEYYRLRLESIASRDGYTILSSDLVKENEQDGNSVGFPGGSVILGGSFDGATYYAGSKNSNGKKTTDAEILTDTEGLLTNESPLTAKTGSTCSNQDFNPELYTKLYSELEFDMRATSNDTLSFKPVTENGPKTAVVNMTGYWGNKTKTIAKMKTYIEEAASQNVELLVFPETVLSGYGWVEPEKDPFYKKYGVSMQVATAETVPGPSTNELSELAKKYHMYIIFGMCEKDEQGKITEDGVEKVYNSAAILYPDGKIDSYQKIHRAGLESKWSVCGTTPKIISTKWGKIGIDICRDGHFYPELGRYYAAKGCTLFVHPTATTGNAWYRSTRIGSYVDRDGMAAITCNLLGGDGIYTTTGNYTPDINDIDENGDFIGGSKIPDTIYDQNTISDDPYWNPAHWIGTGGIFNSTSFIATKGSTASTTLKPRINYNQTGPYSDGFEKRGNTSPLGLEIATMNLKGTGFTGTSYTFNPGLYSKLYDKLATLYRQGYTSVYGANAVATPKTVDLTPAKTTVAEETTTPAPANTKTNTSVKATAKKKVIPGKTTIKKYKKSKKYLTLRLKKIKGISGYQIKYSASKNFKKSTTKTTKNTVAKMKAPSNTYYVKVRTYKKVGKKTYYSKWSAVKKIK